MTSVTLQSIDIDLITVVTLYKSLETYLEDIRNKFDFFLEQAKIMSSEECFSWEISRKKTRKRYFDENETDEAVLESSQKMKCEVRTSYKFIIDRLIINLHERKLAYTELHKNFGFILVIESMDTDNIHDSAKNLVQLYSEDLDSSFIEEAVQFKSILSFFSTQDKSSFINLLKCLTDSPLLSSFPNVEIAMRIFCCMASTNANGERLFSVLKRIKNYLRFTLIDEKMSSLSILSIEDDLLKQAD